LPGVSIYVLREWAIWWLLTPLALKALRQNELKQLRCRVSYIQVGVAVLLASVAFRVAVDLLTEARGTAAVILIYLPRYLAVSIVLALFWHFFLRQSRPTQAQGTRAARSPPLRATRRRHR
jgi:flagellar biosynthesis protein FliQ